MFLAEVQVLDHEVALVHSTAVLTFIDAPVFVVSCSAVRICTWAVFAAIDYVVDQNVEVHAF